MATDPSYMIMNLKKYNNTSDSRESCEWRVLNLATLRLSRAIKVACLSWRELKNCINPSSFDIVRTPKSIICIFSVISVHFRPIHSLVFVNCNPLKKKKENYKTKQKLLCTHPQQICLFSKHYAKRYGRVADLLLYQCSDTGSNHTINSLSRTWHFNII